MKGANLVADALVAAGARTVFTLSGNQVMPIFDACIDAGIRLIHVRHEAAAVYMADAWSQLTGQAGVALLTAAPGFANGLSPLYTARASESAVVLLSGDAPLAQEGLGAFQELQQIEVSAPLCKAAFRSRDASMLGEDLCRAIRIARSGRPGPVHLALPFDLLTAEVKSNGPPAADRFEPERSLPQPGVMAQTVKALNSARRPMVITGPALNATRGGETLRRLSRALDVPVVPMESPRGLRDPALGDLSRVLPDVDLVLSLGKPIDFMLGFGRPPVFSPDCRFVIIGPENGFLERAQRIVENNLIIAHRSDADAAAHDLIALASRPSAPRNEWRSKVAAAIESRKHISDEESSSGPIHPEVLCRAVQRVLDAADDPILVCDGGEFGQWAQACLSANTRLINGPGGAIGGGLCYAIAAKINRPGATVIALMGDGTVGFHLSEFDTALRYRAPFIAVVGHDARWNAEYQIQLRDYGPNRLIGCELNDTRYDRAVAGLGGHGELVGDFRDLAAALERAESSELPACLNVRIKGLPAPSGSGH
jgi:acetolactate synthase-1/2/3 large subunit